MYKFIKKVFAFSMPLIVLWMIFECSLRQVPTIFSFKDSLIKDNNAKIKTMIIGSSVANYGIDPFYLSDSCFNMAIGGQSIRYNAAFLDKHIDNLSNLKNIIWGIGYFMLWYDEYGNNHPNVTYYDLYMDIKFDNNILRQSELISVGNSSFNKWSNFYISHLNPIQCDSLGLDHSFSSTSRNPNKKEWLSTMHKDAKEQTDITQRDKAKEYYELNLSLIHHVVELCEKRQINLFLVIPPTNKRFYEAVDSECVKILDETLKNAASQYDNVYALNYFKDSRFNDNDFFDGHHLSSDIGAKKFSKILCQDIHF